MERDYSLATQWMVTLKGEQVPVGMVVTVKDGYQAQGLRGEPLYPHLGQAEQHGVAHVTVDGAAEELVTWCRSLGDHATVPLYRHTLEAVS